MKRSAITMLLLSTMLGTAFAAKPKVVPPIQIEVARSGNAAGVPVDVTLVTRKAFSFSIDEIETKSVDASGKLRFEGRKLKKVGWIGLSFSWQPRNLPMRQMVFEIRAKNGKKVSGGRAIDFAQDKGFYVLDGNQGGDCANLFQHEFDSKGVLHLKFQVPQYYGECTDAGGKVGDVMAVGSRNINSGTLNYYKFDDDLRMGQQFAGQLSSSGENPPLQDDLVNRYVIDLVNRIGKASDMPELEIRAQVIDADVLNAFAVPGGFIWVYRGLIENTETEAELVGVIAHEIAHVTSRHGTEGMTSAINKTTLATVASQALAKQSDKAWLNQLLEIGVASGTQFWVMGGTRKREAEADKLGAQYAWRAGYDPRGIATLFARWAEQKGGPKSRLDKYFSDHPTDEERVQAVMEDVGYFLPHKEGLITSSKDYERVKAHLKRLPRPQKSGEVAANDMFTSFTRINQELLTHEISTYFGAGEQKSEEKEAP